MKYVLALFVFLWPAWGSAQARPPAPVTPRAIFRPPATPQGPIVRWRHQQQANARSPLAVWTPPAGYELPPVVLVPPPVGDSIGIPGQAPPSQRRIFQAPTLRAQAQWFGRQGLDSVCPAGNCPRGNWRPTGEYGRGANAAPARQPTTPGAPPTVYEAFSVRCRVGGCGAVANAVVGTDGTYQVTATRPANLNRSAITAEQRGNNDPARSAQPVSPRTRDIALERAEAARRR